jgi:glycosyltransferase involved in cell wall biosynthesis
VTLRIAHVITGLALGGAETALYRLLATMDRERFEPAVVSLSGDGPVGARIRALGVPVHALELRAAPTLPATAWRLVRTLARLGADLVQGWQYHGSLAAQLTQPWLPWRTPVLWNIRHCIYDLRDEKRLTAAAVRLGARLSGRAARLIYVARASAVQHEALGYRSDRRVVLPNGFDTERFAPNPEARRRLRAELGLPGSAVLIGHVARYHPMKDHANFLAAARELRRSHSDVHFVLAGDRVDPSNGVLARDVGALGLGRHAHLLGRRDDVPDVLAALDIATSASYSEAFPNVIGEAMACGVPCVATDVGDSALIMGDAGRLVPPRHSAALAEAWRAVLALGEDGRAALGRQGRRRIVAEYGLRAIAGRYEDLYEETGRCAASRAS